MSHATSLPSFSRSSQELQSQTWVSPRCFPGFATAAHRAQTLNRWLCRSPSVIFGRPRSYFPLLDYPDVLSHPFQSIGKGPPSSSFSFWISLGTHRLLPGHPALWFLVDPLLPREAPWDWLFSGRVAAHHLWTFLSIWIFSSDCSLGRQLLCCPYPETFRHLITFFWSDSILIFRFND